jgi:hypothetical protein
VVTHLEHVQRILPDLGPHNRERAIIGVLFERPDSCTAEALDR